jgi:hypothetical protein
MAAAVSESDVYRLLTFHVPNVMSVFRCLVRTKGLGQVRGHASLRNKVNF